jgi:hypothetical protein
MKDLAIALGNCPGALAHMGEALGGAGVNIEGGGAWVVNGEGIAHFTARIANSRRKSVPIRICANANLSA